MSLAYDASYQHFHQRGMLVVIGLDYESQPWVGTLQVFLIGKLVGSVFGGPLSSLSETAEGCVDLGLVLLLSRSSPQEFYASGPGIGGSGPMFRYSRLSTA